MSDLCSNARANVVSCSGTESDLLELEYQLNSQGNTNVLALSADAWVAEYARTVAAPALERFGAIDHLFHAAGLFTGEYMICGD